MNADRRYAVGAGVLFVVATVAAVLASALTRPILAAPVDLARIASSETSVFAGVLLKLVAAIASAGIALALYPVLKKHNDGFALGSVAFRLVEGTFYVAAAMGPLLVVSLSHEAAAAGAADASYFRHSAALLLAGADWLGFVAALPCFGLGALLYYAVLYRTALVPRWLSGWGIVGAVLAVVASVLALFQVAAPLSTAHVALNLPIAAQEMVLAVWLIARGFESRAPAAAPAGATSLAGTLAA